MDIITQLKRDEGCKKDNTGFHIAYRCTAGALTIGYGHNLDANPVPGIIKDSKLTEDQATRLLEADVKKYTDQVFKALPWAKDLSPARQGVLINMAFNLGINGLLDFNNTLRMAKEGDYAGASRGMLNSKWARQVGQRAVRLALQMERDIWA